MQRISEKTMVPTSDIRVISYASVVGKKEAEGPLGHYFDQSISDAHFTKDSWEKAESQFQLEAVNLALVKGKIELQEIDFILAGDLLNQCISSTFSARGLNVPFLGQYGACSTMAQTLILATILIDSGAGNKACAVTSSHFCSAERQFRLPLEYGGQRAPTAQWTATASGCAILGKGGKIKIGRMCVGKIVDLGIKDVANMGAAMAPAAADTIFQFFQDTGTKPTDFDKIFTGDLGIIGTQLLCDILLENGINLKPYHKDCGEMLFDIKKQDPHSGGSGCGCSASVLCGYIFRQMEQECLHRILFCATGALMSPTSSSQGESIPGICHLIEFYI